MAKVKSGKLFSRLPYAVFIDYDNVKMEVPANARGLKILDVKRCGKLPAGVVCVAD